MPNAIDSPRFSGLVRQLAQLPITTDNLLAAHRPNADGYCRACTEGGTGRPHLDWPCTLHELAVAAELHAAGVRRTMRGAA